MIKGIAASSGIAVSKIFKLQHPVLKIEKKTAEAAPEIIKLMAGIEATKKDILAIKENAIGKLADEDLAIFDAHLMVAEDPEFVDQIVAMINER